MKVRQHTLPVLQNLLKRDPAAYREEFEALWKQYVSELEVLRLADANSATKKEDERRLGELATFVSHTCGSYKHAAERFAPELARLLMDRATALQADLRLVLAQACLLSRTKGHLDPIVTMELAFELIRSVNDKPLRALMYEYVVSDIKRSAGGAQAGPKQARRSRTPVKAAQKLLFQECASAQASVAAAKCALDALVELYRKRVWVDASCVNAIGRAATDERSKIACTAVHFFLGVEGTAMGLVDDDEALEAAELGDRDRKMQLALDGITHMAQHSKKTRKRQALKDKSLKAAKKILRKAPPPARPVFPAIEVLEDPHRLCERVLARLRAQKDKFEVRVTFMDFVSRVACAHKLQLLPFYSYMQRYLVAHQRDVARLLAIFAQACHEHIPPDELQPIARHIADAFVSERNAPEAMSVGINALREIVARVPALLDEPEMLGFARDIAAYSKHRDKSVVVAARGWINVVRERYPGLLKTKDRGKASAGDRHRKPSAFGAVAPQSEVDGIDLLQKYEHGDLDPDYDETAAQCAKISALDGEDSSDDEDGWVNIRHDVDDDDDAGGHDGWEEASDDEEDENEDDEDEDEDDKDEDDGDDGDDDDEDEDAEAEDDVEADGDEAEAEGEGAAEEHQTKIEATRILSDDDFARIRLLKKRQAELQRTRGVKKSELTAGAGFVAANDIEAYGAKRKASVEERKAAVLAGREQFEHKLHAGGKTNLEKRRTKNYQMVQKGKLVNPKRRRAPVKEQLKRDKRKRRRL